MARARSVSRTWFRIKIYIAIKLVHTTEPVINVKTKTGNEGISRKGKFKEELKGVHFESFKISLNILVTTR